MRIGWRLDCASYSPKPFVTHFPLMEVAVASQTFSRQSWSAKGAPSPPKTISTTCLPGELAGRGVDVAHQCCGRHIHGVVAGLRRPRGAATAAAGRGSSGTTFTDLRPLLRACGAL